MTRKLEARQRYISAFAADVAHEFKSPLTPSAARPSCCRRAPRTSPTPGSAFWKTSGSTRLASIASCRACSS